MSFKNETDIMLIVNYWHFDSEKISSRYHSFADILSQSYSLEVITSTFCHLSKRQRRSEELGLNLLPYKMTLQYEKGYSKNISFKRIASYRQFGKNVLKYIKKRKNPDLIIVSVPSLSVADYVTKYANKHSIPVIVDIQDLWPEAFKMAFSIPIVSDILFYPMKRQANQIYKRADKIMAVSDTYVQRGLKYNRKDTKGESIYIGSDKDLIEKETEGIVIHKPIDEFWIGYVGALGHSYDIKSIILAVKKLKEKGLDRIKFIVMGEGPLKESFKEYAKQEDVSVEFKGLLKYGHMMKMLMACDIAVNPIVGKSVSSIINKVSDYAAAGIPVVNTQKSMEYRTLLEDYNAGINVENGNIEDLATALERLYYNSEERMEMCQNAKRLFSDKFDRKKNYSRLLNLVESCLGQK